MTQRPTLEVVQGGATPVDAPATGADGFRLTDVGNARRLLALHGDDLRFIHTWRRWLVWDGRRWALDDTGESVRRMIDTVRRLAATAAAIDDADARKALMRHALGSEREARVRGALALAEALDGVPVLHDDLDADPLLLNVANGTLDLRTGELRPHARGDLITKLAPVDYQQDAAAPAFEAFMRRILPDPDLRRFVVTLLGYSLTGLTTEQILVMLYGTGANGKTTLLELARTLFGDYGQQAPAETFLERRDTIPNDVARLRGARFVAATETGEGRRLNEVLVKRLTGGDTIAARFMRSEWFEFKPQFKAWLATNHKPEVRGTDEAIWRRIRLVPFAVTIPPEERDPALPARLRNELPGILNLAVKGCLDWQYDGTLSTPNAVTEATSGYRADSDHVGRFLDDCCILNPDARAKTGDLYNRYGYWCTANGEHSLSQKALAQRLEERGLTPQRLNTGRWWNGVGILQEHVA
ncbi:MAG: DNA primase family protein [Gaiellaceae bacterium]